MTTGELLFYLEFENKELEPIGFEEPTDFVYEYKGNIVGMDEDERRSLIGRFMVHYADIGGGAEAGLCPLEVLDAHASTDNFAELFEDNDFSEVVQKKCNYEVLSSNLLIIERLEILPSFRGKGIGREVLRYLVRRFGPGASIVALKAFPLQFEKNLPVEDEGTSWRKKMLLNKFPSVEAEAAKSLRTYYKSLGFMSLPKSDLMFANLAGGCPK